MLIGTDDVDHPRELDVRIADWFNKNGAKADFWFLGDRGVSGNGHMMMIESNSDAVAKRGGVSRLPQCSPVSSSVDPRAHCN